MAAQLPESAKEQEDRIAKAEADAWNTPGTVARALGDVEGNPATERTSAQSAEADYTAAAEAEKAHNEALDNRPLGPETQRLLDAAHAELGHIAVTGGDVAPQPIEVHQQTHVA